jgi:hypothetical protein
MKHAAISRPESDIHPPPTLVPGKGSHETALIMLPDIDPVIVSAGRLMDKKAQNAKVNNIFICNKSPGGNYP